MSLMRFLNTYSKTRLSWATLLSFIVAFELCALFFEHVMGLAPCVMCIYERVAMAGIAIAALIGLITPQFLLTRLIGLIGWGYCAFRGLQLTSEHVSFQLHPSPFATCDLFVNFPTWMPLNHWIPWMFEAYGECSKIVWHFVGLTMPQCLEIVFAANLIACCIMLVSQLAFSRVRQ